MSKNLNPVDFDLPPIKLRRINKTRYCVQCNDSFYQYRWSDIICPDCDVKRMEHVDKGMKAIAQMINKPVGGGE